MTREEKIKAIGEAKSKIDKDFGKNAVMNLGDAPDMDIEVISTGSLGLDVALGVGGLPKGRIVEIYGPESSGKTTLAIHTIAEAHKNPDSMCAIIDAEHAFDRSYAQKLGVDISRLDIAQPDNGEQGLEIADRLISSGAYDVVVIDSVAALVPKAELEGEMGENKMGLHARLMSQALRKMTGNVKKTNTICIFINQLREKIGVMFGSPEVTTGGNALKFYASVRLDVRRSLTAENAVMQGKEKIGNMTKVKVIKNKVSPPFVVCEFDIIYGEGIDQIGELIVMGKELGVLKKHGGVVTYNEIKYPYEEFKELVKNNPEFAQEINNKIKKPLTINGKSESNTPQGIEI